jgi:hypothetical protein
VNNFPLGPNRTPSREKKSYPDIAWPACSTNCRIAESGIAPAFLANSRPALNTAINGIALIRNRCTKPGNSSVFTFATSQRPGPSLATFSHFGRDHFARSAPWRPKIHQYWQRRLTGHSFEHRFLLHFNRLAGRTELSVTLSAMKLVSKSCVNQAITWPHFGQASTKPRSSGSIECSVITVQYRS